MDNYKSIDPSICLHEYEDGMCIYCKIFLNCFLCDDRPWSDKVKCDTCEVSSRMCENCVSICNLCNNTVCKVCKTYGHNCITDEEEDSEESE